MKLAVWLSVFVGLYLQACHRDMNQSEARLKARLMAIDRPELWSVQAVGQKAKALRVCADQEMRAGFIRPAPALLSETCRPLGLAVRTTRGWAFRCMLGDETYAVSSAAVGDRMRDFEVSFSITPLQGRMVEVRQTLRYLRLGDCPTGIVLGDATDQTGALVHGALGPMHDGPTF